MADYDTLPNNDFDFISVFMFRTAVWNAPKVINFCQDNIPLSSGVKSVASSGDRNNPPASGER
jgi:hypothetical protein